METITHYTAGRAPARILEGGTFPIPGFGLSVVTYGHDEALAEVPRMMGQPVLAVDIETMGLGKAAWYLKVVTVAVGDHAVLYDIRNPAHYLAVQDLLNSGAVLVFHNSTYDVLGLAMNGLLKRETILTKIRDTLIYIRMADPDGKGTHGLAKVSERFLGIGGEDTITARAKNLGITKSKYFEVADLDRPAYRWDAATDALITFRLYPILRQAAFERLTVGHPFTKYGVKGDEAWALVERPQRANGRMLWRSALGFFWDPDYLDAYRMSRAKERASTEAELMELGIRPSNSQDLVKFLDGLGAVPEDYPRTAKTGLLSGAEAHVSMLDHPLVAKFTAHKQGLATEVKYLSKVAELADHNGKVHPAFNILGAAATGRQSISGIPFHQFDKAARGIILEDYTGAGVTSVDWTQQEPVLAANLAGDHTVLAMYEDESLSDEMRDMYMIVANFAKIDRSEAKVVILAQTYGQGLIRLAVGLKLITPAQAKAIQAKCQEINPATVGGVDEWGRENQPHTYWPLEAADILGIPGLALANGVKDKVWEVLPRTGEMVKNLKRIADKYKVIFTLSGRILPIPMAWYRDEYGAMSHKGPNYTVQGGAADMLEDLIIRAEDAGLGDTLMIPMHDEVVVQQDAAEEWSKLMQIAPERLNFIAGRTATFRTDTNHLGIRWGKPA